MSLIWSGFYRLYCNLKNVNNKNHIQILLCLKLKIISVFILEKFLEQMFTMFCSLAYKLGSPSSSIINLWISSYIKNNSLALINQFVKNVINCFSNFWCFINSQLTSGLLHHWLCFLLHLQVFLIQFVCKHQSYVEFLSLHCAGLTSKKLNRRGRVYYFHVIANWPCGRYESCSWWCFLW